MGIGVGAPPWSCGSGRPTAGFPGSWGVPFLVAAGGARGEKGGGDASGPAEEQHLRGVTPPLAERCVCEVRGLVAPCGSGEVGRLRRHELRAPQVPHFRHGGCHAHCHELRHRPQRVLSDAHHSRHVPAAAPRKRRVEGAPGGRRGFELTSRPHPRSYWSCCPNSWARAHLPRSPGPPRPQGGRRPWAYCSARRSLY